MSKILIIEDNTDVRENLSEILLLAGYDTVLAENGRIGAEMALREQPDLILCDVMMPELDGYGVLHILGKNQRTADIPFIFLTAKAEKEDFRRGMTLGADDYITKPFDDVQLLETVATRLRKSERLRQAAAENGGGLESLISEARAMNAIQSLSNDRESRQFRKKDVVFREGETPRWLYFVESGQVKVFKTSSDGRELIMKVAGPGDFLGYLSLLKDTRYTESAAVLEEARIRLIPQQDFHALVFGNRDVNAHFVKMLARHVADQEQQLLDLAYNSVRKRVATAIVQLFDRNHTEIHLLREDLAAIAGTAKETLIRTLTDFKNERLIDIRDGAIAVLNSEKLRNLPN